MKKEKISNYPEDPEQKWRQGVVVLLRELHGLVRIQHKINLWQTVNSLLFLAFVIFYVFDTGRQDVIFAQITGFFSYFYNLYDGATNGEKLGFWGR